MKKTLREKEKDKISQGKRKLEDKEREKRNKKENCKRDGMAGVNTSTRVMRFEEKGQRERQRD